MGFFGSSPEDFDKIIYKSAYGKQAKIKLPKGWSYSVATGYIIGEFDKVFGIPLDLSVTKNFQM